MGVTVGGAGGRVTHLFLHVDVGQALLAAILGRRVVAEPLPAAHSATTAHATLRPVSPRAETAVNCGRTGDEG